MVSRVGRWCVLGPRPRGRLQPGDVVRAELRDQVRREQLERAQVRVDGHAVIRVPRVEALLAHVLHQPDDRAVTAEVVTRLQLAEAALDVVETQAGERHQRRRVQLADAAAAQLRRGHDPAELRRRRHGQEVPLVGPVLGDRAVSHRSRPADSRHTPPGAPRGARRTFAGTRHASRIGRRPPSGCVRGVYAGRPKRGRFGLRSPNRRVQLNQCQLSHFWG